MDPTSYTDEQARMETRVEQVLRRMVYAQQRRLVGPACRLVLYMLGIDIPKQVRIGPGLRLPHATAGRTIYGNVTLGANVTLLGDIAIAVADSFRGYDPATTQVIVGDGAYLGVGCAVLVKSGRTIELGAGTVVGANAVLTQSTGRDEVWAGNPARRVGTR